MVLAEETLVETIALTPAAAEAVKAIFASRNLEEGYALRVFVKGGGCSGLQYGMALENNIREQDTVTDCHDVRVVVDEVSIEYMRGATIDYVDDVTGTGFKVENPNALASCGCGSSQSKDSAGGCSGCG